MPAKINQIPNPPDFTGMDPAFAQHYTQLSQAVNGLLGYDGEIPLQNHINMNGKSVRNIGAPITPADAISSAVADSAYSAPVLKPKLQAGGTAQLSSYRMLNSGSQREQLSSYMNDLMSSVPNANLILPTVTPSGGDYLVSIPATPFTFADGYTIMLNAFTDLIASVPAAYAITSLSVSGGVVTVHVAATGLTAGDPATIIAGTNSSFNGTYILTSSTGGGSVLQYQSSSASGTDTSGSVQVSGVHYYAAKKRNPNIFKYGPYPGDTMYNRLGSNYDGTQIVAVVVVTSSGGQVSQSGGGGTPIVGSPTAGSFF